MATQAHDVPRAAAELPLPEDDDDAAHSEGGDARSQDGLALRFSDRLADSARYVAAWHRWLLFDGAAWRPDETMRIFSAARATCRAAARELRDPGIKERIKSAASVAALERLARADPRHAAHPDQFDADPWLLNTPGGTVDLRSGKLRPHRSTDYCTRTTAVVPGGDCPLFLAFLERIFAGDVIAFVQRALGYALTGVIAEHALFFGHGTGGNGKGVLLNTVLGIMDGYAAVAPADAFTAATTQRRAGDLAMLRGARLVVAQETEQGRHWNEPRIKAVTGGDPIVARMARGETVTFRPRFKLFVAGNHTPELRCVDAAIRRRFKLIAFTATIADDEVDPALPEKLVAEWPGILAWMIEGCLAWRRAGLATPAPVAAATADYLAEEDTLGTWLEELVAAAPDDATETASDLFKSWAAYAAAAREPPGSKKAFGRAMQARGFTPCRIGESGARGYKAISLRRPAGDPFATALSAYLPRLLRRR